MNDRSLSAFHRLAMAARGVRWPASCSAQFHGCASKVVTSGAARRNSSLRFLHSNRRSRRTWPASRRRCTGRAGSDPMRSRRSCDPVAGHHAVRRCARCLSSSSPACPARRSLAGLAISRPGPPPSNSLNQPAATPGQWSPGQVHRGAAAAKRALQPRARAGGTAVPISRNPPARAVGTR